MKEEIEDFYFPTGNVLLDMVVGGDKNVYGFKAGTIINVVGDKSAGKTFIANEIIASAHYKYGDKFKWRYCDVERGYTFDTEEMYGFDINDEEHSAQYKTVEKAYYDIKSFIKDIKKGECGVYVIDSLDALQGADQLVYTENRIKAMDEGKEFNKGTYGMGKQKFMSQEFFPNIVDDLMDKHVLLLIISQVRDKIDVTSFEKHSRAGGRALDFYCHSVLWLAGAGRIEKKDTPIGGIVKAKTTKSKTSRPFRECFYSFLFAYGVDDIGTCLDYLYELRTDTGKLSSGQAKAIPWEIDDSKLEVNAKNLRQWLKDNNYWDDYTDSKFYLGKANLDTELEFVQSVGEINAKFGEDFCATMDREKLISYIEDNDLQEELHNRAIQKWEEFEDSILPNRKKKFYAVQLKNTDEKNGFVG